MEAGGAVRCTGTMVSVKVRSSVDADQSSKDEKQVGEWIESFSSDATDERVGALTQSLVETSQAGGSTSASMLKTLRQGLADLSGRDGDKMETRAMVFALATVFELLLARANLSDVSKLAVVGRLVARELNSQKWGADAHTRSMVFSAALDHFLESGCGFGTADWFQSAEEVAEGSRQANCFPHYFPESVEVDLEHELQDKIDEEAECKVAVDRCAEALATARGAHQKAVREARAAEALRIDVTNDLFVVRRKRRRDRVEQAAGAVVQAEP